MTDSPARRDWAAATDAVSRLLAGTRRHHLTRPTPCTDYDVRRLSGHLIGTARRTLASASGSDDRSPHVVTDVGDDELATTYRELIGQCGPAWSHHGDADPVHAPWGPCSVADVLHGFTVETVVHGWDLAVATGQSYLVLDEVAARLTAPVGTVIPARLRGVMYDRARTDPADASPVEHLAAALGRDVETWRTR